jgi:hypothetical protein
MRAHTPPGGARDAQRWVQVAALQQVRSALHRQAEQVRGEAARLRTRLAGAADAGAARAQRDKIAALEQARPCLVPLPPPGRQEIEDRR